MKKISFEIFPEKDVKKSIEFINFLKEKNPNFISITCSKEDNYSFVEIIKKNTNIKIIPHIICNTLFSVIIKILKFIKIKIFNFIIITGDNCKNNSYNYIIKIRKLFGHIIKIYSGIYLEEHKITKNFNKEILFVYKKKKIGINLFLTQFFYNFSIVKYYLNILKKSGMNKNLIPGIFPKKKIQDVLNFTNKCKIEIPNWIIKNYNFINFKNYYLSNLKNFNHFHFYTFNKTKNIVYYLK